MIVIARKIPMRECRLDTELQILVRNHSGVKELISDAAIEALRIIHDENRHGVYSIVGVNSIADLVGYISQEGYPSLLNSVRQDSHYCELCALLTAKFLLDSRLTSSDTATRQ